MLPTLSQYMLGSAATFSFFLAIGSVSVSPLPFELYRNMFVQVIRNDGELPPHLVAARLQLSSPVMRTRSEGLASMRARWAMENTQKSD